MQAEKHTAEPQQQPVQAAAEHAASWIKGVDASPRAVAQRKEMDALTGAIQLQHNASSILSNIDTVIMLKKDAALWSAGEKEAGLTSTKVIRTKAGNKEGLYRYRMSGNIIDSFVNNNVAKAEAVDGTAYAGTPVIQAPVGVYEHDLGKEYGDVEALSDKQVTSGDRSLHFGHGDAVHKVGRENKYTWHHKSSKGKMELVDMNVHGAMWHYGGIAGWEASLHKGDSDDDPSG